jgi:hypothetical protein
MKIKNLITSKIYVTYLIMIFSRRHRHVWIFEEVDPYIGIILYNLDLTCPPVKKIVIKGLYIPSSTLCR